MGGGVESDSEFPFPLKDEIRDAIHQPDLSKRSIVPMRRVLEQILAAYPGNSPNWLSDPETFIENLAIKAPGNFNEAFDRWRELYSSAYAQLKDANKGSESHGISAKARRKYSALRKRADAQIKILEDGRSRFSSDFYTYRYLATEGFLPGYNFPRLPLYAYVPGEGYGGTFLSRSRFFGISEFGPGNLIYHEGRAYRVLKAKLPLHRAGGSEKSLPTVPIYLCSNCGACHDNEVELCHVCGNSLADNDVVKGTLRIDNVEAVSAERITANDEERVRRGYEIQTVFSWPENSNGQYQVEEAEFHSGGKFLFSLQYASGTQISRINKGLRRRKDKKVYGFNIDPETGEWKSAEDDKQGDIVDPEKARPERIVPIVQERKNAVLLKLEDPDSFSIETKATIQHAIIRGIEVVYQLEQGEVLGEPLPNRDNRRTVLIYEATEGGAGVLKRLVEDTGAISRVAIEALKLMHFEDIDKTIHQYRSNQETTRSSITLKSSDDSCVHGCYQCLLSYYNQLDHEIIERNRPEVVQFLVDLACGELVTQSSESPKVEANSIEGKWLQKFLNENLPVPDVNPVQVLGIDFNFTWSEYFVAATTDTVSEEEKKRIEAQGWKVVTLHDDAGQGVPPELINDLRGSSA